MKFLSILLAILISQNAFGCNWSEGITKTSDNKYTYSKECHIQVGKSLDELDKRRQQVKNLNVAIDFKTTALELERKRIEEWKSLSLNLQQKVNTLDKMRERDKWIWFGIGVLATGAAVYGAGQLR